MFVGCPSVGWPCFTEGVPAQDGPLVGVIYGFLEACSQYIAWRIDRNYIGFSLTFKDPFPS